MDNVDIVIERIMKMEEVLGQDTLYDLFAEIDLNMPKV